MATKQTDEKRYDRQIRLWGVEGQRALEQAHVCLINATATGTETLKNLVLPGIGAYTILDGQKVSEADLGNNFFVTANSVGKSRAAVTCELLQELNYSTDPEIFAPVGKFVEKDPIAVIDSEIGFFKQFTYVIATDLPQKSLLKLADFLYQNNIPLFVVRAYGFLGYLRVVIPEHTIIQSKPDNPPDDLRLAEPWPELAQYAETFNVDTLQGGEHAHVPYVIILLDLLSKWKKTHDGKPPQNYQEKNEFKKSILTHQKSPDEENFPEAHRSAHKAYVKYEIPSEVRKILNDEKTNVNENSTDFWILASAVKQFVANEGSGIYLPLTGSIPDMTATTDGYISLQKIYQDKATKDLQSVIKYTKEVLKKVGKPETAISEETVKLFCKNARFLRLLRYTTLANELDPKTSKTQLLQNHLNEPDSNINWYALFQAVTLFHSKHNRVPGNSNATLESDTAELKEIVKQFLAERNIQATIDDKFVTEMVRFGGSELHTIAALMGGTASQEVIKIITHQYVPLNNTFIFNGLNSTSIKEEF